METVFWSRMTLTVIIEGDLGYYEQLISETYLRGSYQNTWECILATALHFLYDLSAMAKSVTHCTNSIVFHQVKTTTN